MRYERRFPSRRNFGNRKTVVKTFKRTKIGIHCHDDLGLAVANTIAAVDAGATHIQGTFLGFGERCGNCNLVTAILDLQLKKDTISCPKIQSKIYRHGAAHCGNHKRPSAQNTPYVGKAAFMHKGGMHGDGVIKYSPAFEHIDPSVVGNERSFPISEVAGRAIFLKKRRTFFRASPSIKNNPMPFSKTKRNGNAGLSV